MFHFIYRVRAIYHPTAPNGRYYEVYNLMTGESAGAYASYPEASGEAHLRNRLQSRSASLMSV